MKWKILNMADISAFPDTLDALRDLADVVSLPADAEVLRQRIGEFDAYFAALAVRADRAVLDNAKRLRVIATPTTGWDHLDVEEMRRRRIALISVREEREFLDGITCTAEMTWCLLLSVVRRLPWAFDAAKQGQWARDRFRGHQISGMTLGILGYGRLGKMVAEYGKAFRMRVLACDVRDVEIAPGIERADFDRLLRESDVLSIHIHLTEENRRLINAGAMARMKRGAVIINTSRGAIIDEQALVESLLSGQIGGAGLDVIEGEWREDLAAHPLIRYAREHENLVISPHVGGITYEAQRAVCAYTAEKLARYLKTLSC